MTVHVRAPAPSALAPVVRAYDVFRNPLAARTEANGDGTFTVQVPAAPADKDCFVRVAAANPGGTGDYRLDIDFRGRAVELEAFAAGQLSPTAPADFRTLTVDRCLAMYFVLANFTPPTGGPSGVRMAVFDAAGRAVASQVARAGETVSTTTYLAAGTYTVRFEALSPPGTAPPVTTYALSGIPLTDPIGPVGSDPTLGGGGTATDYQWLTNVYDYYTRLVLDPLADVVW
jgi:hypothetical protein